MRVAQMLVLFPLLLAPASAWAEEAEPAAWSCETCPYPVGWDGGIDVGVEFVAGATPWSGRYDGIRDDGTFAILGFDLLKVADDGGRWELVGRDLGLESRTLELTHRRPGEHRYTFEYGVIPGLAAMRTSTPFRGLGTDALDLPGSWVSGDATTDLTQLATTLQPFELGTERERTAAEGNWFDRNGFTTRLRAQHDERRGTMPLGGSLITRSTILPAPVDDVTDAFEAALGYAAESWRVDAQYLLSSYRNAIGAVTWDNPFDALNPAATQGRMALAPDNDFHQLSVDASWRAADGLRVQAGATRGKGRQDDALLPTSITPGLDVALPRTSAAMEVDTAAFYLRGSAPVRDGFTVRGELRYDERYASAPDALFPQVVTDTYLAPSRANLMYGYSKTRAKAEGDWRLGQLRLQLLLQQLNTDRSDSVVASTSEDRIAVELRGPMFKGVLEGAVEFGRDRRDGSGYTTLAAPAPQNPAMRYYHLADLERDYWSASVSASPTPSTSFGLHVDQQREDYAATEIGLTDRDDTGFGFDFDWMPAEAMSVAFYYQRDTLGFEQAGSQTMSSPDWSALSEDATEAIGLEFDAPYLTEGFGLRAELSLVDSTGQVEVVSSGSDRFPEVRSQLALLRVDGSWRIDERYTVRLTWRHERLESADWAISGVAPDTVPNVLGLGEVDPEYEMDVLEFAVRIAL